MKDLVSVAVLLVGFAFVLYFAPASGGLFLEPANFDPASTSSTPGHIASAWYFAPCYAILRAVPDQRIGALLMLLAVASFLFLPWLDRSQIRSIRYEGWVWRAALTVFATSFVVLTCLGLQPAEPIYVVLARVFSMFCFAYFWLMPGYSKLDSGRSCPVVSAPEWESP